MLSYEQRLASDAGWALSEGRRFFEDRSDVQTALGKIARRLNELEIPYAIVGGMALAYHGLRRFTEDVDVLVTKESLNRIHQELDGLGWTRPFSKSKNLRDTDLQVSIDFLVTGEIPGDGKTTEIAFPDPQLITVEQDGIRYARLPELMSLKLASGMTGSDRLKDLADVQELIKLLDLSRQFAEQLHPYVRQRFDELWLSAHTAPKRYVRIWRNKFLALEAKSLNEIIASLRAAASELETMLGDGVILDPKGGTADDYAYLVTTDPEIAKKYEMHDESEYWDDEQQ